MSCKARIWGIYIAFLLLLSGVILVFSGYAEYGANKFSFKADNKTGEITERISRLYIGVNMSEMKNTLESAAKFVMSVAWDNKYGGYYMIFNSTGPVDPRKFLFSIPWGIMSYGLLYNLTGDFVYLRWAYMIYETIDKFNYSGYYYPIFSENFSTPSIPHAGYSEYGLNTLYALVQTIYGLIVFYNITGNSTILAKATELWLYVNNTFWDDVYGGLHGLSDVGSYMKSPATISIFIYDSYLLYDILGNDYYLNMLLKNVDALEKMWRNGFYHSYRDNYTIYNNFRFSPEIVFFYPSIAYVVAYLVTGNSTYYNRASTLIEYAYDEDWDDTYAGFYYNLDSDYNIWDNKKQTVSHATSILMHTVFTGIFNITLGQNHTDQMFEVIKVLIKSLNETQYLPADFNRTWGLTTNEGRSRTTLNTIASFLFFIKDYDNVAPIIKDVEYQLLKDKIKIAANITDNTNISEAIVEWKFNYTSTIVREKMSRESEDVYAAYLPFPSTNATIDVNISATDVFGNKNKIHMEFNVSYYNGTVIVTTEIYETITETTTTTTSNTVTNTVTTSSILISTTNQTITMTTTLTERGILTMLSILIILLLVVIAILALRKRTPSIEQIPEI